MTTESNRDRAARGGFAVDYFNPTAAPPRYVEVPGVPGGPMPVGRPAAVVEQAPDGTRRPVAVDRAPEAQPAPAPGQVWLPAASVGWAGVDGTLTLDALLPGEEGGLSRIRWTNGATCAASMVTAPAGGWRCLGVVTPHGRVMVGDGFRSSPHAVGTIVAVQGTLVRWEMADGWGGWHEATSLVGGSGPLRWERTRYAPARPGERYRWRATGRVARVDRFKHDVPRWNWEDEMGDGRVARMDPPGCFPVAEWERLDPAPGAAAAPSPLYAFALAQLAARGVMVTDGAPLAVLLAHEPRPEDRGVWMVAPDGSRTRAEGAPDEVAWAPGPAAEAPFRGGGALPGVHVEQVTVFIGDRGHIVPVRPGESPEEASRRFLAGRLGAGEGEPALPSSLAGNLAGHPGSARTYRVPRAATLAGCPLQITHAHATIGAVTLQAYAALGDFEQRLRPCLDDGRYVRFELDGAGYVVSVRPGWSACPNGADGTARLMLVVAEGPSTLRDACHEGALAVAELAKQMRRLYPDGTFTQPHPPAPLWTADAPGGLPAPTPPSHLDALSRPSPAPEPSAEEAARRFFQGEGERVAPAGLTGWAEARHPWQMRGR